MFHLFPSFLLLWGLTAFDGQALSLEMYGLQDQCTAYLATYGTDIGNCSSQPCRSLTYALSVLTCTERTLIVKSGTYDSLQDQNLSVNLKNESYLIIKCENGSATFAGGDQSYILSVAGGSLRVENIDFMSGYSTGSGGCLAWTNGGGGGSLTVINSTFKWCSSDKDGGGLYALGTGGEGEVQLDNLVFFNCSSENGGGASIHNLETTITSCTFQSNRAGKGGGLFLSTSSSTVSNSTFEGNTAKQIGGGSYALYGHLDTKWNLYEHNAADTGGGISVNYADSFTDYGSNYSQNLVFGQGGGMYIIMSSNNSSVKYIVAYSNFFENMAHDQGAGVNIQDASGLKLTDLTISNNKAKNYAGIYIRSSDNSVSFQNLKISGNIGEGHGSGLFCDGSPIKLNNVIFNDNEGDDCDRNDVDGTCFSQEGNTCPLKVQVADCSNCTASVCAILQNTPHCFTASSGRSDPICFCVDATPYTLSVWAIIGIAFAIVVFILVIYGGWKYSNAKKVTYVHIR